MPDPVLELSCFIGIDSPKFVLFVVVDAVSYLKLE